MNGEGRVKTKQAMTINQDYCSERNRDDECQNSFSETVNRLIKATGLELETSEAIVREFCKQSSRLIVEINAFSAENNYKEASDRLHQLKGSAGNVRATALWKQAIEAERAIKSMDYILFGRRIQKFEKLLEDFIRNSEEGGEDNGE